MSSGPSSSSHSSSTNSDITYGLAGLGPIFSKSQPLSNVETLKLLKTVKANHEVTGVSLPEKSAATLQSMITYLSDSNISHIRDIEKLDQAYEAQKKILAPYNTVLDDWEIANMANLYHEFNTTSDCIASIPSIQKKISDSFMQGNMAQSDISGSPRNQELKFATIDKMLDELYEFSETYSS
jgi:hypothetical protein